MSATPITSRSSTAPSPAASDASARALHASSPHASTARTSTPAEPPPAAAVRHQATDDVHSLQATRPAAPSTDAAYRGAINEAVRVYLGGGPSALSEHLGTHGAALSSLANVAAGRLEGDLESALETQASLLRYPITGLDAATMQGMVEEVAGARIRQGIVQEAETTVAARVRAFQELSEALPSRLPSLRSARPGTLEHVEAQLLGIRGDAGDLAGFGQPRDVACRVHRPAPRCHHVDDLICEIAQAALV